MMPGMRAGLAPDAMKPPLQRVRTRWIRGFMPFPRLRHPRIMMLMVPERPEFSVRATRYPAATIG